MGEKITLTLQPREVHGKKVAKLRKQGIIPGVIYGHGLEPVSVQADAKILHRVVTEAGKHHPVHITIEGKKRIAMIKDVDHEPVKRAVRHVSFHAVKQNEKVTAEVPIHLIGEGESAAEKAGLIVLQALDKIEVKALPMDLPDALEVNITELAESGDRVTLGDIKLPSGVEFLENDENAVEEGDEFHSITELVVANVYEPSALQAQNEAAAGTAEDAADVQAENGSDTDQESQAEESRPGGKGQEEPKQSNVDANKN